MYDTFRKIRISSYFDGGRRKRLSVLAVATFVAFAAGALLLYKAETWWFALPPFGLGALLLAGFWSYRSFIPQDAQIDAWLDESLWDLLPRARAECNLKGEEVRSPEIMIAPLYAKIPGMKFVWRKGQDKNIRVSPLRVIIMLFSRRQLGIYQCDFDFLSGEHSSEGADVYLYKAIIATTTACRELVVDPEDVDKRFLAFLGAERTREARMRIRGSQYFVLKTNAGTAVEICLGQPRVVTGAREEDPILQRARKAVRAIQAMLEDSDDREAVV